jgi:hypothetical protein
MLLFLHSHHSSAQIFLKQNRDHSHFCRRVAASVRIDAAIQWGALLCTRREGLLLPTLGVLAFVISVNLFVALGSLAALPANTPQRALEPQAS